MSDFLMQKRQEIANRLKELKPLVEEYQRLEAAQSALDQVGPATAPARRGPRRAAVTTTRTTARRTARRAGRRRGSGHRTQQTLELVNASPQGITIPELAAKMGIRQNYLYRILPNLQRERKVRKRGRHWLPASK